MVSCNEMIAYVLFFVNHRVRDIFLPRQTFRRLLLEDNLSFRGT